MTQPAPSGRIAFRRYFDDAQTHGAVFTINADGSAEKQITNPPPGTVDDQPDFSPDGSQIAFQRCAKDGLCSAMVVPSGGGEPREVRARCKRKPVCDVSAPAWTPDARLVVNVSEGREKQLGGMGWIERSSLVLVDPRSGEQRAIFRRDHWSGDAQQLAVSPDGRTVAYQHWNSPRSKPAEAIAIFAVGIDGTHHHRLTPWELSGGNYPVFSPDGTKVLFQSYAEDESEHQPDLWTVALGGGGLTQVTHLKPGRLAASGSYSPDGAWIVHATNGVAGKADVFIMRADGTDNRPLTRTKLWDSAPDWAP